MPWSKRSEDVIDPQKAREVLDADHSGLEDVKARITEHLAVRKLRKDRGLADDKRSGAILTLVGLSRHGQDVDRRVDRQGDGTQVRAHRSAASAMSRRSAVTGALHIGALPGGGLVRACATPGR